MKMMLNGLDRPFELLNSRYGREAQKFFHLKLRRFHLINRICLFIWFN
jgi:hypothetical protein